MHFSKSSYGGRGPTSTPHALLWHHYPKWANAQSWLIAHVHFYTGCLFHYVHYTGLYLCIIHCACALRSERPIMIDCASWFKACTMNQTWCLRRRTHDCVLRSLLRAACVCMCWVCRLGGPKPQIIQNYVCLAKKVTTKNCVPLQCTILNVLQKSLKTRRKSSIFTGSQNEDLKPPK